MEEKTKQRLVGVLVFVGALFVILPFLFHNSRPMAQQQNAHVDNNPVPAVAMGQQTPDQPQLPAVAPTAALPGTPATPAAVPPAAMPAATGPDAAPTAPAPATPAITASAPSNPQNQNNGPATNSTANASAPAAPAAGQQQAAAVPDSATTPAPVLAAASPNSLTPGEADDQPSAVQKAVADNTAAPQPAATPAPTAATAEKPAVEKPVVEKKAVAVEKPIKKHLAVHKPIHGFTIQVGVFSEKQNAMHLVAKLHESHFRAYSEQISHHGRRMTAVFVGPERTQMDAKMAIQDMKMKLSLNGEIKDYRG